MVKDLRQVRDPTLALILLSELQLAPLCDILNNYYPTESTLFREQLFALDNDQQGNDVDRIVCLLKSFQDLLNQTEVTLSSDEKELIEAFLDHHLVNLYELIFNVKYHKIVLQSSTDAFTLNQTCFFINALNVLIEELHPSTSFTKPAELQQPLPFYSGRIPYQLIREVVALADELRCFSQNIVSQIGSPESMPRGLVITFMWHLCDAQSSCGDIYKRSNLPCGELCSLIDSTIQTVKTNYPDLAMAGEELHKAIANTTSPKP